MFVSTEQKRKITLSLFIIVVVCIMLAMAKCSMDAIDHQRAQQDIRDTNNGAIPGKEIVSDTGVRTSIRTYRFPTYNVICLGGRSGGCFVEPEDN